MRNLSDKKLACRVQFAPHAWDYYEERGRLSETDAISLFREFPFDEKLAVADALEEGTVPTVSVKDEGSEFAAWLQDPGVYRVYLQIADRSASIETGDRSRVEAMIRRFYRDDCESLFSEIQKEEPAKPRSGVGLFVLLVTFWVAAFVVLIMMLTSYVRAS